MTVTHPHKVGKNPNNYEKTSINYENDRHDAEDVLARLTGQRVQQATVFRRQIEREGFHTLQLSRNARTWQSTFG
jgi:hypothetical protein